MQCVLTTFLKANLSEQPRRGKREPSRQPSIYPQSTPSAFPGQYCGPRDAMAPGGGMEMLTQGIEMIGNKVGGI